MNFMMLRQFSSAPSLSVFIMKGHWTLSDAFSTLVEIIMCGFFFSFYFVNIVYYFFFFHMLNHSCIPGILLLGNGV